MARITYDKTKPFGAPISLAVSALINAQSDLARVKAVADQVTVGGTVPANLEGSAEFGVGVAQGATFYTNLQNMIAGLAAITVLAQLDQGN
jgi:hypothetical protein